MGTFRSNFLLTCRVANQLLFYGWVIWAFTGSTLLFAQSVNFLGTGSADKPKKSSAGEGTVFAPEPEANQASKQNNAQDKESQGESRLQGYEGKVSRGDSCVAAQKAGAVGTTACKPDEGTLDTYKDTMTGLDAVGQATATAAGQGMQAAAANASEEKKFKVVGEGQILNGTIQNATGVAQIATGVLSKALIGSHSTDIKKIDAAIKLKHEEAAKLSPDENKDREKKQKLANEIATLEQAKADHGAVSKKATGTMLQGLILGAKNLASGAILTATGLENLNAKKQFETPKGGLTPIVSGPGEKPQDPGAPNPVASPIPMGNELPATASENEKEEEGDRANPLIPPGGNGPSAPGGLAGKVPGATNGQIGPGNSTQAGGAGGGGGLGGGGNQPPGEDLRGSDAETLAGNGVKFDSGGGGSGNGFASAAGGGNKRMNDTGMDLNGLLAQFLPKKEEEDRSPANSILDYGKKGAGPGSEKDDGSILGRDGPTLFARISKANHAYFQKGNLRK